MSDLRVLVVEDRPTDAELVVAELRRAGLGIEATVVDDEASFVAALGSDPDLILADYSMPSFGALPALRIVHDSGLDVPLIVVSGTISEEIAVECMHLGAADYLLKDRLGRLGPAVRRAIERRDGAREQRAAEAAVRERDALLLAVFDRSTDAMLIADDSRRCIDSNPAAVELLGLSRGQITERRIDHILASGEPGVSLDWWAEFIGRGEHRGELALHRQDGSVRQIEYRAKANFVPDRHLCVLRDVTEWRRMEDQLRQSQKMEAIGRLAGGVAHDFNNQLSVIIGYTELLENGLAPEDPRRDDILAVRSAADRAVTLTGQLLAFSRRQALQVQVVDPGAVIAGFESMLRRLLGERIALRTHFTPDSGNVRVDPGQLEQVIMNLVINARDAMPDGGDLTIETSTVDLDPAYARAHIDVAPGRHVLLAVSDTGHGMDSETRSRLFEPFFTTKEQGRGTGLGLATVYGVVKQSGGHIWVYSEPGHGTSFKVYLPLVEEPADVLPVGKPDGAPQGGSETILVVEDDDAVRALIIQILNRLGYSVQAAADPAEALRLTFETPLIDGLLTDVVMPGMSGGDLAERVIKVHPDVRVLYTSGYTENSVVHHGVIDRGVSFVQKPFTPQELARRLRAVLDG